MNVLRDRFAPFSRKHEMRIGICHTQQSITFQLIYSKKHYWIKNSEKWIKNSKYCSVFSVLSLENSMKFFKWKSNSLKSVQLTRKYTRGMFVGNRPCLIVVNVKNCLCMHERGRGDTEENLSSHVRFTLVNSENRMSIDLSSHISTTHKRYDLISIFIWKYKFS